MIFKEGEISEAVLIQKLKQGVQIQQAKHSFHLIRAEEIFIQNDGLITKWVVIPSGYKVDIHLPLDNEQTARFDSTMFAGYVAQYCIHNAFLSYFANQLGVKQ